MSHLSQIIMHFILLEKRNSIFFKLCNNYNLRCNYKTCNTNEETGKVAIRQNKQLGLWLGKCFLSFSKRIIYLNGDDGRQVSNQSAPSMRRKELCLNFQYQFLWCVVWWWIRIDSNPDFLHKPWESTNVKYLCMCRNCSISYLFIMTYDTRM